MRNILKEFKAANERFSEFEDITMQNIQNETQEKKEKIRCILGQSQTFSCICSISFERRIKR